MRSTHDLRKLYGSVSGRLGRLRRVYGTARAEGFSTSNQSVAYIAVELDNLILSAVRHFVISCLTGARTTMGDKVTCTPCFQDEGEVAAYIMSVLSPVGYSNLGSPHRIARKDEFKIREPRLIERVMASCAASNLISVQAAYAYNTGVFTDLPTIRNFYAHRNDDTWRKVRNRAPGMGVYGAITTDQVLMYQIARRPVSVLEDWLDDVDLFFFELTR